MTKIMAIAAGLLTAIGAVAALHGSVSPASAEITTFHAVTIAATQSGDTGFAWIISQDGSGRLCTVIKANPQRGPECVAIRY